ncbi:unnamed protein product [Blepharisma stoltei]|uniref:Uncharacterized protein n=1 Tax=Blepharisma stoltei TaxID=1481888 RepID=A0AAU9JHG1_9CILI|nr:unnamed protein product [Blepharisma stoltei]
MVEPEERRYKIVILGNSGVGKTCLIYRFAKDTFLESTNPTIGANFYTKHVNVDDKTTYKFDLWDTAGQERYKSLTPMYYKGASAALIVYDATAVDSFEGAKDWIKELHNNAAPSIVIALAANKIDLNKGVSREMGQDLANKHSLLFSEVSAKTGEGISETFINIAKRLPKIQAKKAQGQKLAAPKKQESWCC